MAAETPTLAPAALTERERVLGILRAHEAELRARGVLHLSLFGSMARGEAGPESDIDLVHEIQKTAGAAHLAAGQHLGVGLAHEVDREHRVDPLQKAVQELQSGLGDRAEQTRCASCPAGEALDRRGSPA